MKKLFVVALVLAIGGAIGHRLTSTPTPVAAMDTAVSVGLHNVPENLPVQSYDAI